MFVMFVIFFTYIEVGSVDVILITLTNRDLLNFYLQLLTLDLLYFIIDLILVFINLLIEN